MFFYAIVLMVIVTIAQYCFVYFRKYNTNKEYNLYQLSFRLVILFLLFILVFSLGYINQREFPTSYEITSIEKVYENKVPILLVDSEYGNLTIPYNRSIMKLFDNWGIVRFMPSDKDYLLVTKYTPYSWNKMCNPFIREYENWEIHYKDKTLFPNEW